MNRLVALVCLLSISAVVVACSSTETSSSSSSSGGSSSGGSSSGSTSSSSSGSTTSTSSGSTVTEKFACGLNGSCYKCPSSDALKGCFDSTKGPTASGCTSTDSSFCN